MLFKLKSQSKYGTAYYTREGFKQAIAVPSGHFEGGTAPQTLDLGGDGVTFATKQEKVKPGGVAKALKGASSELKKQVREAARRAERETLAAAGISL